MPPEGRRRPRGGATARNRAEVHGRRSRRTQASSASAARTVADSPARPGPFPPGDRPARLDEPPRGGGAPRLFAPHGFVRGVEMGAPPRAPRASRASRTSRAPRAPRAQRDRHSIVAPLLAAQVRHSPPHPASPQLLIPPTTSCLAHPHFAPLTPQRPARHTAPRRPASPHGPPQTKPSPSALLGLPGPAQPCCAPLCTQCISPPSPPETPRPAPFQQADPFPPCSTPSRTTRSTPPSPFPSCPVQHNAALHQPAPPKSAPSESIHPA